MQNDMVENITRELNNKITTEVQTVYLLVQIRKLMESKTKKPHFTLKMFCDWALHIELTRNKQIKDFLKEFDEAIGRAENGYGSINYEWFTLKKFKEAMKDFLTEFNLPKNILESSEWSLFLRLYNSVVSDCPVTKKDYPFKFIEHRFSSAVYIPQGNYHFSIKTYRLVTFFRKYSSRICSVYGT